MRHLYDRTSSIYGKFKGDLRRTYKLAPVHHNSNHYSPLINDYDNFSKGGTGKLESFILNEEHNTKFNTLKGNLYI